MNKERAQILLDFVTNHLDHFLMREWVTPQDEGDPPPMITKDNLCGTALCLAGWAVLLFDGPLVLVQNENFPEDWRYAPQSDPEQSVMWRASRLLGLTDSEVFHLFLARQEQAIPRLQAMILESKEGEA